MTRAIAFLLAITISLPAVAAPRRRAVAKPVLDTSTVRGWLEKHAYPLTATELTPYSYDLEPLRSMIGDATLVGLGDGTHGTHEYYTVKLRLIDFLVREMGFTAIGFEAPYPIFERLNQYVLGGPGDPRAILREARVRLFYVFWDVEELLAVIEWARDYNLHRGGKPPVEINGFDIFDWPAAADAIVAYLRTVDPAAAATAEADYACARGGATNDTCRAKVEGANDRLRANRDAYSASGARAYADALRHAEILEQYFKLTRDRFDRDHLMSLNALWSLEHRGKTILWAHQEHLGNSPASNFLQGGRPMGHRLAEALGDDYFTIATLSSNARFLLWSVPGNNAYVETFAAPPESSYEWYFSQRGLPALLIPLRGALPSWLIGPAQYHTVGTNLLVAPQVVESLPAKFDAVIYIETTTPTRPLP